MVNCTNPQNENPINREKSGKILQDFQVSLDSRSHVWTYRVVNMFYLLN